MSALWAVSAFMVAVGLAHVTTTTDRLVLAIVGVLPPLVVWFWLQTPSETLSETIHRVRDEGPATRRNPTRD